MSDENHYIKAKKKDRPRLLVTCLLFSLVLHLLLIFILQQKQLEHKELLTPKPTFVRLIDKPLQKKVVDLEVDQVPTLPEEQPTKETTRLAEKSQRVEKEQAPKGTDERDQAKRLEAPPSPPSPPPAAPAPPATPEVPRQAPKSAPKQPQTDKTVVAEKTLPADKGRLRPEPEPAETGKPSEQAPVNYPSLQQLTQLSQETLNRSIASGRSQQEKIKQRDDVEEGDTVWLNLERGLLISFFRRFRNSIEGVWNYPPEAVRNGEEGLLQLKIIINRSGELFDVELIKSSGSGVLDLAAIQAVYAAAPFGPLPRQYPHPQLKVYAHFRYELGGKHIYGKTR